MQTDFYEDRLRVFLEEFKKNTVAYSEKIEGFLYKPCEYKVGNELPVVDKSFKSFEKMTAGAENMMHTPGSIKN